MFLLTFFLLLPSLAVAFEPHDGFYLGAYLGAPLAADIGGKDAAGTFQLETAGDPLTAFTLGYELLDGSFLGTGGRIELEYSQRGSSFSEGNFSSGDVVAVGDLAIESLMLNCFATYRTGTPVSPYLGLGLGAARMTIDDLAVAGLPLIDDEVTTVAGQGGLGLDIDITSWLRLDVGYRFFYVRPEFTQSNGSDVTIDYREHSALVGAVVKF
ncbi:MAG: hypothetical protein A2091_06000 [Desulfuromonadales bacterium GWD2_61_12]|nr:MAG: hypothetical protein A2091_06000 [Desulfuromonadales bacterium GWD2_61_12]